MRVAHSWPTLCDPRGLYSPGTLQAKILEWVAFPLSRGSSQPGIEPGSPALQADSLPPELSGILRQRRTEFIMVLLDIDYMEAMLRVELGELDKNFIRPLEALRRNLNF